MSAEQIARVATQPFRELLQRIEADVLLACFHPLQRRRRNPGLRERHRAALLLEEIRELLTEPLPHGSRLRSYLSRMWDISRRL